jgi:hypothetical protein
MSVASSVASRPSRDGAWASEWLTIRNRSRLETRQFIGGSDDSPVSTAKMWRVSSP